MLLSELLKKISFRDVRNFADTDILNVDCDSRKCKSGHLFVALEGENHGACAFVSDAVKRGAAAIVTECSDFETIKFENVIFSDNARKTMAEVSKALYGECLKDMTLIGVTGTKGKTTTALCLKHILSKSGIPSAAIGTLGLVSDFFGYDACVTNTTPESCELYRALRDCRLFGIKAVIVEVSSQALIKWRVYGIEFTAAVFTNISEDHIGVSEHPTYNDYYRAKKSLFMNYGVKTAFINKRSEAARDIAPEWIERYFVDYRILTSVTPFNTRFMLGEGIYEIFGGEYNCENAALAISVAERLFGVDRKSAARALLSFRAQGRSEMYTLYGKKVVIDYAHNRESVRAVLSYVSSFTEGRVIAVFGSVGMRSFGRREMLAAACEECADISVITADNPNFEPAESVCAEIYSYFNDKSRAFVVPDRSDAIISAISLARTNDTVVLLGKGHERFQLIKGERKLFSERALILSMGARKI